MVKILLKEQNGLTKATMSTEIYLCNIFEDVAIQYPIKDTVELLKIELDEHCRHKPRNNDKLKDWYKRFNSLVEEISRFVVLQSLGVEMLPIKIVDGKVVGLKDGIEVEVVKE